MSDATRRIWLLVAFVSVAGWMVGCGGTASTGSGDGPAAGKYVLVPATSASLTVPSEANKDLPVFLYNKSSGDAVSGERVDYELVSAPSSHAIGTLSVSTDDNGHASTTFYPGGVAGEAVVEVSHPKATTLKFQITVTPEPTGHLAVTPISAGVSVETLSDVTLRMYSSDDQTCEGFSPLNAQPDPVRRGFRESTGEALVFREIAADKTVTVTARARGERGQLAGAGCKDGIDIVADQTTRKELVLNLIPLQPEGRYQVTSRWDFSEALKQSGSVGSTVVNVLEGFQDPGQAIYNQVIGLVENTVGGLISEGLESFLNATGLDDQFKSLINNTIQNNEALCKVREAGRDLRRAIKQLEVDSELVIGQLGAKYTFRGRDNWLGIQMYWRGMCDDAYESACGEDTGDDPPETMPPCAAIELTAADNGEIADLGVISSKWDGRVASYNELRIQRHEIPLNYGRLVKFILNQVVIPELTDGAANSLSGAFAHWIGCESLGDDITGSDDKVGAFGAEVSASQISNFCESAVNTVFGFAELAIGNLEYETGIRVGGTATLVETTSDGEVDYLEDGSYTGYIRTDGGDGSMSSQRSNLSATWEGERVSSSE
jgi:hypothetical protein